MLLLRTVGSGSGMGTAGRAGRGREGGVGDSRELARLSKRVRRVGWKTLSFRTGAIGRGDDKVDLTSPCALLDTLPLTVGLASKPKHQQTYTPRMADELTNLPTSFNSLQLRPNQLQTFPRHVAPSSTVRRVGSNIDEDRFTSNWIVRRQKR